MGEAGAALADDATAMYYNPAGLAFGPLADEWRMSYPADSKKAPFFTKMTARTKGGFFSKSELWAGTANGILKFDSEQWLDYHSVTLQGNAKVKDAVRVFVGSERGLDEYSRQVKKFNNIKNADDESHVVEVKIPWNLVVKDTITAILYEDRTEKLWVGTPKGLFRFDGKGWKNYEKELGVHRVNALVSQGASIWIGTDDGLFVYRNGGFEQKGKVLPSQKINALTWSEMRKELYVAVDGAAPATSGPPMPAVSATSRCASGNRSSSRTTTSTTFLSTARAPSGSPPTRAYGATSRTTPPQADVRQNWNAEPPNRKARSSPKMNGRTSTPATDFRATKSGRCSPKATTSGSAPQTAWSSTRTPTSS